MSTAKPADGTTPPPLPNTNKKFFTPICSGVQSDLPIKCKELSVKFPKQRLIFTRKLYQKDFVEWGPKGNVNLFSVCKYNMEMTQIGHVDLSQVYNKKYYCI